LLLRSPSTALAVAAAPAFLIREQAVAAPQTPLCRQPEDHCIIHDDLPSSIMQGAPPAKEKRVTIANYRENQANRRWVHQHMREIFPTQNISRGRGPVAILPIRLADVDSMSVPDPAGATIPLSRLLRQTHTDAFIILHKGVIVTEQYFHGMQPETPHNLWSVGKSVSAGVVANLLDQGRLDESCCVVNYIPEWKGTAFESVTIRHLMDMVSGVLYEYEAPNDGTWRAHTKACGASPPDPDQPLDQGEYDFLAACEDFKTRVRSPGSTFYYKECDARGLIWACEKVTGRLFVDLFSEMIWSKLGTEQDAYVCTDGLGAAWTNAGISMTLRDFARWGQMHLERGHFNGEQIVPASFIQDIRTGADPSKIKWESFVGPRTGNDVLIAYRSQFWIPFREQGDFAAAGFGGQWCYIDPEHEVVIAKFSTYDDDEEAGKSWKYEQLDVGAFQEIARVLGRS
jgi:CubicO group peptidase (beta-lactamase class C family)